MVAKLSYVGISIREIVLTDYISASNSRIRISSSSVLICNL